MKLLLVDANEPFAHELRGELLRSGAMLCDLEFATSFTEAVAQLGREPVDAILIDPFPLADAPASLYRDLQQLAPRAPILVLSDESDDALVIDAVRRGAHDYLSKSQTRPEWLLRRVRYAIDRQRSNAARVTLAGPHHGKKQYADVPQCAHESATNSSSANLAVRAKTADDVDERSAFGRGEGPSVDEEAMSGATSIPTCWRVLQIESDPVFLTLSEKLLQCDSPYPLEVTQVKRVVEATERLKSATYDAVLLNLSLPDSSGLDTLTAILPLAGDAPVLVITATDETVTAIDGMRRGAEDFLSRSAPDLRYLRRATQLAVVRRDRVHWAPSLPVVDAECQPARSPAATERRRSSRYLLTKPIFATPVLPDGSPAATYSADGFSVDVSEGGLRFEIGNLQRLPTTQLLVGIEGLDTVLYFATVEARHVVPKGNGLDVGAQFATGPRDLIRRSNLEPTFNPATSRYETGLPLDVIMKWVEFGIFRPALFDRVFVCPQCRAIPTFRNGCRVCGSVRLHSRPLIHHFACAHVGYVSDFEQSGAIICPKCRTRNLIVGADFEHLNGPYHCLDCDWSDTELDTVGQCMKCELRFPMAQAIEQDLIGYHVNRLDPLAFINAG